MSTDEVRGIITGIKCVMADSVQWRELAVKYNAERKTNEAAVAAAIATALVDLAERMSAQVGKAMPS